MTIGRTHMWWSIVVYVLSLTGQHLLVKLFKAWNIKLQLIGWYVCPVLAGTTSNGLLNEIFRVGGRVCKNRKGMNVLPVCPGVFLSILILDGLPWVAAFDQTAPHCLQWPRWLRVVRPFPPVRKDCTRCCPCWPAFRIHLRSYTCVHGLDYIFVY